LTLQLPVQSVHIITKVVSSNPIDLRELGGFLWVLRCPPPLKLTATT
jgi:hypothetical protein